MIVFHKSSFSLVDRDGNSRLLILVSSESLGLLGRDNCATGNNLSHNTAYGLDTERQGCNVDEKQVFSLFGSLTTEDATLNGSTVSDGLIRIDAAVGLLSVEELLDK